MSIPLPSHRDEVSRLVRLATPIVLAQLGLIGMGVTDVVMSGRVSGATLAAVSIGNAYHWSFVVFGQGILFALDPIVSQAFGARDSDAIRRAFRHGIALALMLTIPFIAVFQFGAPLLRLLGQPPEVIPLADGFVRALAPGLLAHFLFLVLRQTLQAQSITRYALAAVIIAILSNLFFNWLFLFGPFGLPRLGAVGTGISTTISRFVMLGALAWFGRAELRPLWSRLTAADFRLSAHMPMLRVGVPIGFQTGLESWAFLGASFIVGRFGTDAIAGNQIVMTMVTVTFMVPLGIGAAAATRVGNAIGAQDYAAVKRSAYTALFLGPCVMLVSCALFALIPSLLARLFTSDVKVIAAAEQLMPLAAAFQLFDGTQAVGCGILRGRGDTRAAAVINFIGYWMLGLPIGIALAFPSHVGPIGIWIGLTVGLAVVAVLIVARVRNRIETPIRRAS